MIRTTVFKSNKTQAVRLPKPVAMPESVKEVDVVAEGNRRIISPAGTAWDDWFSEGSVTDDFLNDRNQPETQAREPLDD